MGILKLWMYYVMLSQIMGYMISSYLNRENVFIYVKNFKAKINRRV